MTTMRSEAIMVIEDVLQDDSAGAMQGTARCSFPGTRGRLVTAESMRKLAQQTVAGGKSLQNATTVAVAAYGPESWALKN